MVLKKVGGWVTAVLAADVIGEDKKDNDIEIHIHGVGQVQSQKDGHGMCYVQWRKSFMDMYG